MEKHIMFQIMASLAAVVILSMFVWLYNSVVATPRRLRRLLREQGIGGPPPANFLLGNVLEIKKLTRAPKTTAEDPHNFAAQLQTIFHKWRRQFELTSSKSIDLGRPLYLSKDLGSLLGKGVSAANGKLWEYERKLMAPGVNMNKIQGMKNSIQQSAIKLIDSWKILIDEEGGKVDIKADTHLLKFSGDAILRVCFGSNYVEGEQILEKFQDIVQVSANKGFFFAIPGMRYVPTKQNRREWKLRKDIKHLISKILIKKHEAHNEENMLKFILEGAKNSNLRPNEIEDFIIDNCKSILSAGYETLSVAASWLLMLLASNREWQDRVREEVLGVCKGQVPDFDSIRHLKQLTMVIYESLRLYTGAHIGSRYAINDLEFANIRIPKGVIIWTMTTTLHTDPNIWGPDSYKFKPERFANGISGACKLPHLFTPFGYGTRICFSHLENQNIIFYGTGE
ncbi:hypothetical protein SASPL_150250 [Salvia splendens]|uniref:Cytochrome P450 714C2-like n=1 Tax=Salvia splendens TaxID=180675 RepID=A0A8X8Z2H5_SALSN|nr:hypothetical protein SASPL_150250 [Salvia splendens]